MAKVRGDQFDAILITRYRICKVKVHETKNFFMCGDDRYNKVTQSRTGSHFAERFSGG